MKAHVIENGKVINTIEVDSLDFMPNLVEATEGGVGWLYDGTQFTDPNALTQAELNEIKSRSNRDIRDQLLQESDWTQFNDSPLEGDKKIAWATYRQELRDLTVHANWPNLNNEDWPVAPS